MLIDLGSFALTAGTQLAIDFAKQLAGQPAPCEVKLQNESPLTLQVKIGADAYSLGAWTVDKYPLCGHTEFSVNPSQIQSPAPAGVPSSSLLVMVAPEGDSIPGVFPAPLARMSNVQSPQTLLGTVTAATAGNQTGTFTIPNGTHALGILIESGAALTQLKVTGTQSGGVYLNLPGAGVAASLQGLFVAPELSALDTSVGVFIASTLGATVAVVAIQDAEVQFIFNNPSQPSSVNLVSTGGGTLGDVAAAPLAADQGTDSIVPAASTTAADMAIVSFKPAAGQTIAQVGALGPLATESAAGGSITPAYGQAPTAGHLLVCVVGASTTADFTTATPGWVKAVDSWAPNRGSAVFYKPNSAGGDVAPTITEVGSATSTPAFAQLSEWSGVATAAPVDQTGTQNSSTGGATSITQATGAVDAQSGDLVVVAARWTISAAGTATFSESLNNGTTVIKGANSGGNASAARHSDFFYGIVPAVRASLPLGVRAWDVDASGTSAPAAGSAASVVLAASTGKAYRVKECTASTLTTGAVATAVALQLKDGSTVIGNDYLGAISGTNTNAVLPRRFEGLKGSPGNSMTWGATAGAASVEQAANISAYLQ